MVTPVGQSSSSERDTGGGFALLPSQKGLCWLAAGVLAVTLWVGMALLFHRSDGTRVINCGNFIAHSWRDPVTGRLQPSELIALDRDGRPVCNKAGARR